MDATKPLCISDAVRWNEYVAVPIAFAVNLFLAFLILVRSPKSLKIYNRVLLTNCACDVMLSAACLLVGFHVLIRNGIVFEVSMGIFAGSSSYERFTASIMWLSTQDAALLYLCIPFIFRYFAVCRSHILSGVEFVLVVGLVIGLAMIGPISAWIYYWPLAREQSDERSALLAQLACENPGELPMFRTSDALTLHGSMPILLTSVVLSGSYVTIAWTSIKIRTHLKRIVPASKKTTILHQQLNRALLLQAYSSWIVSFVPLMLAIGVLLFSVESGSVIAEYHSSTLAWIPVLNPTLTVLCISGYRREAVRLLQELRRLFRDGGSAAAMGVSSVNAIRTQTDLNYSNYHYNLKRWGTGQRF